MRRISRLLFATRDAHPTHRKAGMKDPDARLLRSGDRVTKTSELKPEHKAGHKPEHKTGQNADVTDVVPKPIESGVFIAAPEVDPLVQLADAKAKELVDQVTLVVYGWHNVQPGTLSWVFPSVTAAVAAARAMTNAVRWAIVRGRRTTPNLDVEAERASGLVLIES